jgi:hypothetical protein
MAPAIWLVSNVLLDRVSAITIASPLSRRSLSSSTDIRGTSLNFVGTWLSSESSVSAAGSGVDVGAAVGAVDSAEALHEIKSAVTTINPNIKDIVLSRIIYLSSPLSSKSGVAIEQFGTFEALIENTGIAVRVLKPDNRIFTSLQ